MAQEYGLQLYSLREQFKKDVPGTLQQISKWGINEIEGADPWTADRRDKKMLADNKLTMISVGADFQLLKTNPQAAVDSAKRFNAKYVVCFWIPHKDNDFDVSNAKEAVEVFNNAGKILKENGIFLCYHAHGFEFRPYENGTLFDYLAKNTNPQYFNFEMDVFWVKHPGQNPVALLKKISE